MFDVNRRQLATIRSQGVRVKDQREKDPNHIMEFGFEIPLDAELAQEILPAMRRDLFDDHGDPLPNMAAVTYNIPGLTTQRLVVRDHPELEPVAAFNATSIRAVNCRKADDGKSWILAFMLSWILGANDAEMQLIRRIKKGQVYLQLSPEQPALDLQAGETSQAALPAGTEKPKRGRKRKGAQTPEAEATAQQAEGTERAADEVQAGGEASTTH